MKQQKGGNGTNLTLKKHKAGGNECPGSGKLGTQSAGPPQRSAAVNVGLTSAATGALVNPAVLLQISQRLPPALAARLLNDFLTFLESLLALPADKLPTALTAKHPAWDAAWSQPGEKSESAQRAVKAWAAEKQRQELALMQNMPSFKHLVGVSRFDRCKAATKDMQNALRDLRKG
jgi:hypothetical protein